ncbi:hypothetical protein AMECASPLE_007598 [Ameca splendens]|uniref:Uncharacterized protein n=1 Tax=Ameca splendens TaxID=208324 RepID=A0ABV0YZE6_9TELE
MAMRTFAVVVLCAVFLGVRIIAGGKEDNVPTTNAYCKIVWLLGIPCEQVNVAIVTQIKDMASYKLVSLAPKLIQANHTSGFGQLERVNFTMIPTSMILGCHLQGTSVPAVWFSLFDNGANYCNLRNVIKGSGLDKAPGFLEFTNEWLCLGCGQSAC